MGICFVTPNRGYNDRMARFFKHGLTLCLFLTAVTGGVMLTARREPLSDFARLFMTNPNGSLCRPPCLFGIQPDETSYQSSVAIMKAHPVSKYFVHPMKALMPDWYGQNFNFLMDTYNSVRQPTTRATAIYMDFTNEMGKPDARVPPLTISAGDVIRYLGNPEKITTRGRAAWLYYPEHRLTITVALYTRDIQTLDATDPDPVLIVHLR